MKRILAIALALLPFAANAQTIKVDAQNLVASDEMFNVKFSIEGEKKVTDFTWNPGSDFQLVYGPQKGSSSSMTIINGKMTSSVTKTFTYVLSPKSAGRFTLSPASAKVDGTTVYSPSFTVEVVSGGASQSSGSYPGGSSSGQGQGQQQRQDSAPASSSDATFLRLSCSRTSVVVGEPIYVTLKLYTRESVSGFDDVKLPTFNGFWNQDTTPQGDVHFARENYNNMIYDAAVLKSYVIIPQKSGDITVDPAELVCLVSQRVASRGGSIFDGFFDDYTTVRRRVSTGAKKIHVSPLPSGAPASFGGGVGKFTMKVKMSRDSLATHEAASLVVTVSGKGNISLLEAPKVSFPPDMEVYDTKTTSAVDKGSGGISGSRSWEYPFIPRSYGDFTLEPVKYAYYDSESGRYVTLESQPLEIHVAKGVDADVQGSAGVAVPQVDRRGVKNLGEDIRYIVSTLPKLRAKDSFFVGSGLFAALTALLLALAAAAYFLVRRFAARRADVAGTRTRQATKMALRRLRQAKVFLDGNLYTAFYEELHKALLGFVSDKLNMPASELSKDSISAALKEGGVSDGAVDDFIGVVDACEFARYAPDAGHEAMAAHYEKAVGAVSTIDSVMKGKKNTSSALAVTAVLMLLPAGFSAWARDAADSADAHWQEACAAYSDGRWEDAATEWSAICRSGVESPELYYNLGNAYFKSDLLGKSILCYERALKLDPGFGDARYNLEIAVSRTQDDIEPVPEFILKTWVRNIGYMLDSNAWAVLFLILLAAALAFALMFLLASAPGLKRTGFFTGIAVLLLSLAALGFSIAQKNACTSRDSAVVMGPVVSVKSSPSAEASTDLFVIHEGTRVGVLETVGDWTNISLADGRQGWLKTSSIEII